MLSRTNFICSDFNNIGKLLPSDNYYVFLDFVIKALVSGFGPFPLVSIEVKDKVAKIDLGEPCTIVPGVKISIDGSGISELDTGFEIEEVEGNFFYVNVDTPDVELTNGLTFSYISLGWSLVFRDNITAIFKMGDGGTEDQYIMLRFERGEINGSFNTALLVCHKIIEPKSLTDWRTILPSINGKKPAVVISTKVYSGYYDNGWFVYGDPLFAMISYTGASSWATGDRSAFTNYRVSPAILAFGELKNDENKKSSFLIYGEAYANINDINVNINSDVNNKFSKLFSVNAVVDQNSLERLVFKTGLNEFQDSYLPAGTYSQGTWLGYSGNSNTSSSRLKNFTTNYFRVVVYDSVNDIHGYIPGLFHLFSKPTMSKKYTNQFFLFPVKATGKLTNRKVYAMYGNPQLTSSYHQNKPVNQLSTCLLDLSGPIH